MIEVRVYDKGDPVALSDRDGLDMVAAVLRDAGASVTAHKDRIEVWGATTVIVIDRKTP